jgi:hypothetical protein
MSVGLHVRIMVIHTQHSCDAIPVLPYCGTAAKSYVDSCCHLLLAACQVLQLGVWESYPSHGAVLTLVLTSVQYVNP